MNKSFLTALASAVALTFGLVWFVGGEADRSSLELIPVAASAAGESASASATRQLREVGAGHGSSRSLQPAARGIDARQAPSETLPGSAQLPGAVQLRVSDRRGRPMSQSGWMLVDRSAVMAVGVPAVRSRLLNDVRFRERANELGIALFDGVPPGEWGILPQFDGVTAPLLPIRAGDFSVDVAADSMTHVALQVERMAVIHGFVHDADGRSEVTWLRATTYTMESGHPFDSLDAHTEDDGTFRMFVPPGKVRLETQPCGTDSILRGVVGPAAQWLDLAEGSTQYVELVYGAGRSRATGRVVDQHGEPWTGLRATLHVSWTSPEGRVQRYGTRVGACVVDEHGSFSFETLPAGDYTVRFEHPLSDFPCQGGIGEYPVAATFEADGARSIDVGTSLVYRWENVRVEGFIARMDGESAQGIRLAVELPPWNRITDRPAKEPIRRTVQVDVEGRFTFEYSAHVPGELKYVLVGSAGARSTVIPFDVSEPRDQALTLLYP